MPFCRKKLEKCLSRFWNAPVYIRIQKREELISDGLSKLCKSRYELTGQQVVCEYCGGVIRSEFYDWQTERFEVYERIGTNLRRALLLTGAMGIVYDK